MSVMAEHQDGTSGRHTHLDEVSKGIIEELQQDGRRSYAAIGKVVGLSEAAVRQRVQRLIDSGVMQIVAVTDPMELGFAPFMPGHFSITSNGQKDIPSAMGSSIQTFAIRSAPSRTRASGMLELLPPIAWMSKNHCCLANSAGV